MGNPQSEDNDTLPLRVKGYYGRPPVTVQQVDKTYAQATTNGPSEVQTVQHSPKEINQLATKLEDLQKEHDQLKKSLHKKVAKDVLKEVDTKLVEVEKNLDKKIKKTKSEYDKKLNDFMTKFQTENSRDRELKQKQFRAFRKSLLAAIAGKKDIEMEPPSGDDDSAHGEDE